MRTILERLEDLENVRKTQLAARSIYDVRSLLKDRLNRMAARMRAGGNWPPESRLTVKEVKQRINELFAMRQQRRRPPLTSAH
jgi:hypothetical protein